MAEKLNDALLLVKKNVEKVFNNKLPFKKRLIWLDFGLSSWLCHPTPLHDAHPIDRTPLDKVHVSACIVITMLTRSRRVALIDLSLTKFIEHRD